MSAIDDAQLAGEWWKSKESLEYSIATYGPSNRSIESRTGVGESTIRKWRKRLGIAPSTGNPVAPKTIVLPIETDDAWLLALLKKKGDNASVEELADAADLSPKKIREALSRLSDTGYRVAEEDRGVVLNRIAPEKMSLHPGLLTGEEISFGVVSDTHLCSQEEALPELHLAYDTFADQGITQVLHAGDLVCGMGIFRGQNSEINLHTLDAQVDYAVDNYPDRDGITTHMISGNHDIEGSAGSVGFDPVAAFAQRRDDVNYLGPFSASIGVHGGGYINLLHGKGGMGNNYSGKAHKIVEVYPPDKKPAILIPGHWHVQGNFMARGIRVLFPGCFEWQSRFMTRLGLQPAVGFHIIKCVFADDGALVQFEPRWFQFYHGREVEIEEAVLHESN